jgi:hypothetical protein
MVNPIILSEPVGIVATDICYTAAEWSAMVTQINSDANTALWIGIIIGAVVVLVGLYLGTWYGKNRK